MSVPAATLSCMNRMPDSLFAFVCWRHAAAACRREAPDSGVRAAERPNVLLVTIDTLRADHVGCYGYQAAATPTLDALAARGVRFETADCAMRR